MAEQIVIHNAHELEVYKKTILMNLDKNIKQIKYVIDTCDALDVFKAFKFDKIAIDPLSGNQENLIEVINQVQTYLVSIMAVEHLYQLFPMQEFIINWGNIPGYDIESLDGAIIAECFAATSYKSNGKLTSDLKRLSNESSATYKYIFFYDKEFTDNHKSYYKEKYPDVEIIKFMDIH